ncbi:alpha/beta hydrolase [Azospirillum sp. B2RO_4]|uniref:alpha/beta hydrolase n=1 Tax=Azospirillum sp. B2RO_4 TaxID=3027796 RepID=UPI003DAA35AF
MEIQRLDLWNGRPPFALGDAEHDHPVLEAYLPSPERRTGAAILSFPGGAYTFLSERSGRRYGEWFAERGVAVFVVKFRLGAHGYDRRAICADGFAALERVHALAGDLGIDRSRIGLVGTSAGGHLAGVMMTGAGRAVLDAEGVGSVAPLDLRPAFSVLCYAVLSLTDPIAHKETRRNFLGDLAEDRAMQEAFSPILAVRHGCPRAFIWHTAEDTEVSSRHSLLFADALERHGVGHELHLYQRGPHALGLALEQGLHWAHDCLRWIENREPPPPV